MEEIVGDVIIDPGRGGADGTEVLEWLGTAEALSVARRQLQRSGFGRQDDLVSDVVADAGVGVLKRMRSETPFTADNPAAYGTRVIQNVVKGLVRGDVVHLEDIDEHATPEAPPIDDAMADDLRVLLENADAPSWLTAASLAYVCLAMFPDAVPLSAPAPMAGARPDQALVWPALWFAGERELFSVDGTDPAKRKRARRMEKVRDHMVNTFARCRSRAEVDDV